MRTMLRVALPWMIGRAFETLGKEEFIAKLSEHVTVLKLLPSPAERRSRDGVQCSR